MSVLNPYNPMHLYIYSLLLLVPSRGSIKAEPQHNIQQPAELLLLHQDSNQYNLDLQCINPSQTDNSIFLHWKMWGNSAQEAGSLE